MCGLWLTTLRSRGEMFELVSQEAELEAVTGDLSIATFRYVPSDLERGTVETEEYLNKLNAALVETDTREWRAIYHQRDHRWQVPFAGLHSQLPHVH